MILQISPESSWLVRSAASLVLTLHISAGGMGLLSGTAAMLFRKGNRLHRMAGNVFVGSMLIMSAIGACVSPFLPQPQWENVIAGTLTFYLVATSWATVRRKAGSVGHFEMGAFIVALSVVVAGVMLGLQAANSPTLFFVFATIAALAAVGDFRMILRRGVCDAQRIARHLWRMCLALLLAAISFFLGQSQIFPASVRASGLLFMPEIAILGSLIFWLVHVQFTIRFKHDAADRSVLTASTGSQSSAATTND